MSLARLKYQCIDILPAKIRNRVLRKMLTINPVPPAALTLKIAETRDELAAAFALLHDAYVEQGYMEPVASGKRITRYHALPTTTTIIAQWEGRVVGTVSLVRDNSFGLPLDRAFNLDALRTKGSIAEISSLAIHRSFRGKHGEVLFPLLKFLYEYCVNYFGIDMMVIGVHPRHAPFYEAILFFESVESSTVNEYDFVNGNPVVARYLDLREAPIRMAIHYGTDNPNRNLFSYFALQKFSCFLFPPRPFFKVADPVMTPDLFDHFFNRLTSLSDTMTDKEKVTLWNQYDPTDYDKVLPRLTDPTTYRLRTHRRFEAKCRASITTSQEAVLATVTSVSLGGIAMIASGFVGQPGTCATVRVAIGDFEVAALKVCLVWASQERTYGFKIVQSSENWHSYIQSLQGIHETAIHSQPLEATA